MQIKTYWEGAWLLKCLIQTAESSCDHWKDAEEDTTVVALTTSPQQVNQSLMFHTNTNTTVLLLVFA